MTVDEVNECFMQNIDEIIKNIITRKYKYLFVRRMTISKENRKKSLLGIPTMIDSISTNSSI